MVKNPDKVFNFLPGQTYPEHYQLHFEQKCTIIKQKFSAFCPPEINTFPSIPQHYRLRAEFRVWHQNDQIHYAMMTSGEDKAPRIIDYFSPGSLLIQTLMPLLLTHLNASDALKNRLFQIEFLTSLKGEALITLIYHRKLDDAWLEQAHQLKEQLKKTFTQTHTQSILNLHIVGRSRGQKICVDQDFIYEQFTIDQTTYTYQQIEGSFTQPNGLTNEALLSWASTATENMGGDLLELYCGNGNFTLPLAKKFNKVLATEVSKTSIQAAQHNLSINKINNVEIARLSSEEAAQAINRVRPFRRLANIDLDVYQFSTILVDPPRAGLDSQTLELAQQFDNICYISCNPDTLIANLVTLTSTHQIKKMAFFDQFPYTHHMECAVLLTRADT